MDQPKQQELYLIFLILKAKVYVVFMQQGYLKTDCLITKTH